MVYLADVSVSPPFLRPRAAEWAAEELTEADHERWATAAAERETTR